MGSRLVETADTLIALDVQLSDGRTSATALVAVREADTANSWLDFADSTFKTSAWTTRQSTMSEVSSSLVPGLYRTTIDISALLPVRTAGDRLIVEYDVSATGPVLQIYGHEELVLINELYAPVTAKQNYAFDSGTDKLKGNIWIEKANAVGAITAIVPVLYDKTGAAVFTFTTVTGPDAQGVWRVEESAPGLVAGETYYVVSTLTVTGVGSVVTSKGFFTV